MNIKNNSWLWYKIITLVCLLLVISSCDESIQFSSDNNTSVVRIYIVYIGENNSTARTIIPSREVIAGYQLTFSGPGTHEPVNITEGNSANVALANGSWKITATAYKLGGVIGNENDAIASGSITINRSSMGSSIIAPPIILSHFGSSGIGTLDYTITVGSGVSGYMRMFEIDGTPVSSFGNNGELLFSSSISNKFNLPAGRYISEVRVEDSEGKAAFYREVVEIWKETTTVFIFEPSVFFDTSMRSYNYGDFNIITNNHSMIIYTDDVLNITGNGSYHIKMKEGITETNSNRIVVASGVEANITLSDVKINVTDIRVNYNNVNAFDMLGAIVNLTLIGENVFVSGHGVAGIHVHGSSTLIISAVSTGFLHVTGGNSSIAGSSGAGIGAGRSGFAKSSCGTIIINGGTITANGGSGSAGIGGEPGGASGTISITGGTVTATGGKSGAGIGGGNGGEGGTISITGGTVTATSGDGAGIGGGGGGEGGTISITGGTVTTATSGGGAGIGGGSSGAGGTMSITGGIVTATSRYGTGIGGGRNGESGVITAIGGNAIIFASSIQPDLPTGENLGTAFVCNGYYGVMYGNSLSVTQDVTVPSDRILGLANGQTLTVQSGYTLTNNGIIIVSDGGNVSGVITGNQPIASSLTISGGSAYTYPGGLLTITGDGSYTIGMRNGVTSTTVERIVVASRVKANIIVSNVDIQHGRDCAFDMTGADVNLTLVGDNVFISGRGAGLQVPVGSSLIITEASTGSLTATGRPGSTGIGSYEGSIGGNITISGGTITATGGQGGSDGDNGIGGTGSTIRITGGTVNATGASGIGGSNSTISIIGGTVTTGSIIYGNGANINIAGGIVTARLIHGSINITGGIVIVDSTRNDGIYGDIKNISGNAVIFARLIEPPLPTGANLGNAIIFTDNNGIMYGNVILQQNVTFASNRILNIPNGQSLTIPSGRILTNNGRINNNGTIYRYGVIDGSGSIVGNQPQ